MINEPLEKIAEELGKLAFYHKELGKGDATYDTHGAIEWLAMKLEEAGERIAYGLNNIANAIRHEDEP